ncbi:MAG TPA: 50S ribosomal protein L11 methyltransferase [Myxococcota bacterium]|nr:50S ribosomal protein L11 methyltransferase [Myxococcota bacterium]
MAWLTVRLEARGAEVEALSDALLAAGALSVSVADARAEAPDEAPLFGEPGLPATPRFWEACVVSALLPEDADPAALVAAAAAAAGVPAPPRFAVERLEHRDWVRETQRLNAPLRITPRLWVVHSWHEPPDPTALNLRLDPGLAFGTGAHATTRLCLAWLEATIRGGETVLDYGTGSGILAIAALRLGAARAAGVDLDPQALSAAAENAERNGVRIALSDDDGLPPAFSADVVVANILAGPLVALAPRLAALARPGAHLALSGLLADQARDIGAAYAAAFSLEPPQFDDGWALLAGTRRG